MKNTYRSFFSLTFLMFLFYAWNLSDTGLALQKDAPQGDNCIVTVTEDQEMELGKYIDIDVASSCSFSDVTNFEWSPTDYLDCPDCWEPTAQAIEDICYTLNINWNDGCVTTEEFCITIKNCPDEFSENHISSITPQEILDNAEIELEIALTQYVHLEIVDNGEIKYSIWEGWLGAGLSAVDLDFSDVPSGNHELRARLYPENRFINIVKL